MDRYICPKILKYIGVHMKRILPTLLAIILVAIVFTGCNPLFPIDKDQFDLRDSVIVKVGEKIFES